MKKESNRKRKKHQRQRNDASYYSKAEIDTALLNLKGTIQFSREDTQKAIDILTKQVAKVSYRVHQMEGMLDGKKKS